MKVPVVTAAAGERWEAGLVQALDRRDLGITVVRRCVDLADLLAVAGTGTARVAVVSGDLRRLDGHALSRLAASHVAVVGLVPPDDEDGARRLQHLGVHHVLPGDADPGTIAAAVLDAVVRGVPDLPLGSAYDARAALPESVEPADEPAPSGRGPGRVVAVWGPTGAPGRTTVAVTLAAEVAALGIVATLVDADVYGGAVAQTLGLLDEAPGLAAAARLANTGSLDRAALARVAREVSPTLRVLTGIVRPDRWPELSPTAVVAVLELLRQVSPITVVDCGFCLEQDEELAFDLAGGRRNGVTLAVLEDANVVLVVGGADPVSVQRLVRGVAELRDLLPGVEPRVVVNRVRPGLTPGRPEEELGAALERYAGVTPVAYVPEDRKGVDAAMAVGRTLREAAPGSPALAAVNALARALVGRPAARRTRRLARRP